MLHIRIYTLFITHILFIKTLVVQLNNCQLTCAVSVPRALQYRSVNALFSKKPQRGQPFHPQITFDLREPIRIYITHKLHLKFTHGKCSVERLITRASGRGTRSRRPIGASGRSSCHPRRRNLISVINVQLRFPVIGLLDSRGYRMVGRRVFWS